MTKLRKRANSFLYRIQPFRILCILHFLRAMNFRRKRFHIGLQRVFE